MLGKSRGAKNRPSMMSRLYMKNKDIENEDKF